MIDLIIPAICVCLYLFYGYCFYRVFCKLVWLSNDIYSEACDKVEENGVFLAVVLFWPVLLVFASR